MNKLVQGSVVLLGLAIASPVFAADMPLKAPAPVYVSTWDGWYVGIAVGEKWKTDDWKTECIRTALTQCGASTNPFFVDSSSPHQFKTSGLRIGGYFGANSQYQNWVYGFEGDWAYYKRDDSVVGLVGCSTPACGGFGFVSAAGDSTSVTNKWDASLRLRGGYLVGPDVLLYATGGIAWQGIDATMSCDSLTSPACINFNHTETQSSVLTGYTVGAGIEWKIWRNLLLRAEYRYSDFGNWKPVFFLGGGDSEFHNSIHVRTNIATLGIAYKFDGWGGGGGPVVAKY